MGVLDGFILLLNKYEKNKAHNVLSLVSDPKLKKLREVSFIIDWEHGVFIFEEYDKRSLFPMLLKCYHIFHPMEKFGYAGRYAIDEECNFDIFEVFIRTNEPTT